MCLPPVRAGLGSVCAIRVAAKTRATRLWKQQQAMMRAQLQARASFDAAGTRSICIKRCSRLQLCSAPLEITPRMEPQSRDGAAVHETKDCTLHPTPALHETKDGAAVHA